MYIFKVAKLMILFDISDKTLKNTDYAELRNDEIQK